MASVNVCRHFKFGFCKYGNTCKFQHNEAICDKSDCSVQDCPLRHPVSCRFYGDYQRCKFGSLSAYRHVNSRYVRHNAMEETVKLLDERVKNLHTTIMSLTENIDEKFKKINDIEKEISLIKADFLNEHDSKCVK